MTLRKKTSAHCEYTTENNSRILHTIESCLWEENMDNPVLLGRRQDHIGDNHDIEITLEFTDNGHFIYNIEYPVEASAAIMKAILLL